MTPIQRLFYKVIPLLILVWMVLGVAKGQGEASDHFNLIKPVDTYFEYQSETQWDSHAAGLVGACIIEHAFIVTFLAFVYVVGATTTPFYLLPTSRGPPGNKHL